MHTLTPLITETLSRELQSHITENFVGNEISKVKFAEAFVGGNTVRFARINKPTVSVLANSRAAIVKQDITAVDETFVLDQIYHHAHDISIEEDIETTLSFNNEFLSLLGEQYAEKYDSNIFSKYASAAYTFDDGNLTTASNGGAGNPIILAPDNALDFFINLNKEFNLAKIGGQDRKIIVSPYEEASILSGLTITRETEVAEARIKSAYIGTVSNVRVSRSTNLSEVGGTRHSIACKGKPICFGQNIKPHIYVSSISENTTNFTKLFKSIAKFGSKMFLEGAENTFDVQFKV